MTDSMSEKERLTLNPLRLLRCGADLARMGILSALSKVDDAQDVWGYPGWDMEIDFTVEAPVPTEEELTDPLF